MECQNKSTSFRHVASKQSHAIKVNSFVLLIKDSLKVFKGRYTLMNVVLGFVIQTADN